MLMTTREELDTVLAEWRRGGERVVFTNGCFDLLHEGHRRLLREAAAQGTRLLVGVNSDVSVRRLKGRGRPIQPAAERAGLIAELRCVDATMVFDEDTPELLIQRVRPDVLVKGGDYADRPVAGAEFVLGRGGRVHLVEVVDARSTSQIVAGIVAQSE